MRRTASAPGLLALSSSVSPCSFSPTTRGRKYDDYKQHSLGSTSQAQSLVIFSSSLYCHILNYSKENKNIKNVEIASQKVCKQGRK